MSEKRFTIKSTATELELYDNGVKIGEFPHYEWVARPVDYVVKTLNEQQSIIEHLTVEKFKENKRFTKLLSEQQVTINKLQEENASLKQRIRDIKYNNCD